MHKHHHVAREMTLGGLHHHFTTIQGEGVIVVLIIAVFVALILGLRKALS